MSNDTGTLLPYIAALARAARKGIPLPTLADFCAYLNLSVKPLAAAVLAALDTIHIDRSTRPAYPYFVDKDCINDPDFIALEQTGPADYALGSLEQYLHGAQKTGGWERGEAIYEYLKGSNTLSSCLGLADLLAIQKLGIEAFRKHFASKVVSGWKSVVRDRDGNPFVPCLVEGDGGVVLFWTWFERGWNSRSPALRFAS
ncbi:MAG: hypothetical protein PHV99_01550 [Candidatus Pacebacteria bacterium]|nr:hypothetical protein [Candidatus Paceibacterota bacterium]